MVPTVLQQYYEAMTTKDTKAIVELVVPDLKVHFNNPDTGREDTSRFWSGAELISSKFGGMFDNHPGFKAYIVDVENLVDDGEILDITLHSHFEDNLGWEKESIMMYTIRNGLIEEIFHL
eukprot:TRINITY_DN860_c0_g1_i2.p2 TRINITY_DN860_c0_g1~~TRINITY_DN860_c0_g1_i2.p2  ORF type:complete len:120 (+),score=30.18 TRINITY_DN860_c0_g1_i2:41-400(+)